MTQNNNANSFPEVFIVESALIKMSKYEKLHIDLFVHHWSKIQAFKVFRSVA